MKKGILFFMLVVGSLIAGVSTTYGAYDYIIKVNFKTFKLFLYNTKDKEIATYRICLPKFMPHLPIKGEVIKVVFNPLWYPTEKTRADYLAKYGKEFPKIIKPSDPRNAMGKVKIEIKFFTPGVDPAARIHGTNNEASIGKRQSRWCIRLFNKDIIKLGAKIKGKRTKIIFYWQ